jgi:Protein of unknown function (DUF3096)
MAASLRSIASPSIGALDLKIARGGPGTSHVQVDQSAPPWLSGMREPDAAYLASGSSRGNALEIIVIQPIVALIAGILILIVPRLLNYIVAVYLILVGITGLLGHV